MLAVLHYNFPVFSAVLLLIAGILIGYALWIPFRGDTEGISRQLNALRDQNDKLEKSLKQQRDAYVNLERRNVKQQDEWDYLRTWHERVETALQEQGLAAGSIEQGLAALQDLKEHALRELDIERKRRTDIEDELHDAKHALEQLHTSMEDYRNLQAKYDGLNSDFNSLKREYSQLLGQHEIMQESAAEVSQQLAQQVNGASVEAAEELDELRRTCAEQQSRADQLNRERAELLMKLQNERDQRSDLEKILQTKEEEFGQRSQESQQVTSARVSELEQLLDQASGDFQQLAAERDNATVRLDDAHHQINQLQTDVESHRRAFETVERHRNQFASNARREHEARQVSEQESQTVLQELGQLKAEVALAETVKQQNAALERQFKALQESHQENQRAISLLKRERDEAAARLADERAQRDEVSQRIERYLEEVDSLREQREEVLRNLRVEQIARRDAEQALDEQTHRLEQISRDVYAVEDLRDEVQSLRARLQHAQIELDQSSEIQNSAKEDVESTQALIHSLRSQLEMSQKSAHVLKLNSQGLQERYDERIEQLTMERNNARASVELAEEKMAELQRQMDQLRSTVAELRREREDVLSRLRRQTVMLESHMVQNEVGTTDELTDSDEIRRDERRGIVYVRRPARVDDLKRISGVAEVLEQKLNDLGIYTYRQIMEWDDVAVEELSQLLSFRDRIQRDEWIAQARRLHEQAYGKAA